MTGFLDSLDVAGRLKRVASRSLMVLGAFALVLAGGLAAAGFLVAALYVWLDSELLPAAAAAVTGGVLLVLCCVVLFVLVRLLRSTSPGAAPAPQAPRPPADAMDIASREVARNPIGAVLTALAAGVVYGLTNRPPREQ